MRQPHALLGVSFVLVSIIFGCVNRSGTLTGVLYGNAQGYGGMITLSGLSFYSINGRYSCTSSGGKSQKSWHSIIHFPSEGLPYAQLKGDACTEKVETLCSTLESCPAELEFPPLYYPAGNPYLMGYKDRIYEQRPTVPDMNGLTEKFVSAWCRSLDANFDQGVDVIIRQGLSDLKENAFIFVAQKPVIEGGGKQVLPFEVQRGEGSYSRQYQADAFSLTISLDTGTQTPNKYSGTLHATIDSVALDRDLLCRIVQ